MSEEAEMEIEALEAIYGDELQVLEAGKRISVQVVDPNDDDLDTAMRIEMKMEFTENYPEEVPIISVRGMKQLTRAQVDPLHHLLKEKGEELLGQQMVYELATYLQEWMANGAEDPNKKEGGFEGQKMVIENNVKHGTPVSRENFASWLEVYEADRAKTLRVKLIKVDDKGEVKLSGRQIFDKAINTVDWDLFKDGEVADEDIPDFGDDDDDDVDVDDEETEES